MLNISFKLYRSKKNKKIHQMINTSAWVWNHCVALQKRHYRLYKKYIPTGKLQKHIGKLRNKNLRWQELNSQTVQELCQRLDLAYKRFFKRLASNRFCHWECPIMSRLIWIAREMVINIISIFIFAD